MGSRSWTPKSGSAPLKHPNLLFPTLLRSQTNSSGNCPHGVALRCSTEAVGGRPRLLDESGGVVIGQRVRGLRFGVPEPQAPADPRERMATYGTTNHQPTRYRPSDARLRRAERTVATPLPTCPPAHLALASADSTTSRNRGLSPGRVAATPWWDRRPEKASRSSVHPGAAPENSTHRQSSHWLRQPPRRHKKVADAAANVAMDNKTSIRVIFPTEWPEL